MDINFKKLVRVGVVSSTDPAAMTVRVTYPDEGVLVSEELCVLNRGSKANKDYWMPDVGEQVLCLFAPNARNQGYCLGSFFSDADSPPGGVAQHKRILEHQGDLEIKCSGTVNITGTTGDVIVNGISLTKHIHPESIGTVTGPPQ